MTRDVAEKAANSLKAIKLYEGILQEIKRGEEAGGFIMQPVLGGSPFGVPEELVSGARRVYEKLLLYHKNELDKL